MSRDATLDLPFDQYQRYRLVADILESLRGKGERLSVLDVGGRTALLRQFLPEDEVYLVDVEASEEQGLVLGDGSRLPYADGCVDALVTFDTLEHVPPAAREAFVAECARVARRWVVIAGPYKSPRVDDAETQLETFVHDKLEEEHRYLAEHKSNGLPDLDDTEGGLRAAGAEVVSIGHANIERWLALMCMSLYMDRDAPLRGIAKQFFRFYNEQLYRSDHAAPVYRHAVVAAFGGASLPDASTLLEPPVAPAGALDVSMSVVKDLLGFDLQRDAVAKEWARLEEVNKGLDLDLDGHKRTLLALREVQDEQTKMISELQSHCIDLTSNAEELEEELDRERDESSEALETLGKDLAEHKTQLGEVEGELGSFKKLAKELEKTVEQERAEGAEVKLALEEDLAGHKLVIEGLNAEVVSLNEGLVEERKAREELQHELNEQQQMIEQFAREADELRMMFAGEQEQVELISEARQVMKRDLDGHRALVDDLRVELVGASDANLALDAARQSESERAEALEEQAVAQQQNIEASSARARTAEEGIMAIRAEFEAQNERLRITTEELAQEREVINQMRQELRMRWGNLKRALGPKPTFGPD